MKLFYSPTSPFVRKVSVLILEAGLGDIERVPVSGTPLAPGTLPVEHNPLGKIPALVLDDGQVLFDSRVICRFLDDHAGAGLYPQGDQLWDVLTLEALADGMLEAALLVVYESRLRPEELRFQPWMDGQWAKVERALSHVEEHEIPMLSGSLTMGQIALACALGYLDFRHGPRGWREGRPNLAAWYAAFSERPSMRATVPVG